MASWHIGTLEGRGVVFADGLRVGEADYEINVTSGDGGQLSALGDLRGNESTLEKASKAKEATLRLDNGEILPFTFSRLTSGAAKIDIEDAAALAGLPLRNT